jgi:hypothetical protein
MAFTSPEGLEAGPGVYRKRRSQDKLPHVCDNIVSLLITGKRIGPSLLICNIKGFCAAQIKNKFDKYFQLVKAILSCLELPDIQCVGHHFGHSFGRI